MPRTTASTPAKSKIAAEQTRREVEAKELRKRIERLEERIEESFLGDDGAAQLDPGIDKTPSGDALQKAVRRSNVRRGSRKA